MVKGVEVMSHWTGLDVYLPDGRKLGIVHDAVIDAESLHCTHLFVRGTPEHLVEGSIPLAVAVDSSHRRHRALALVSPHAHPDSVLR